MALLQGNLALVGGLLLLAFVIISRAFTKDLQLKGDLRGATLFLSAFVALRLLSFALFALDDVQAPALATAIRVGWMLAFAFGAVRSAVAFGLWLYRRLRRGPTSKILRDLLDFVLYLATALPIIKMQLNIDLSSLLATSAIVSVVLGLAMQETLGNLFAGLALQLERPYANGDHISVAEFTGRVIQIAWRATRIQTVRQEEVTIPNSLIAKQAVRNFTRGGQPIGIDLFVGVAYEAPPNVVRAEVLAALAEIPLVRATPAPLCRVAAFEDSSVKYLVRVWFDDYGQHSTVVDEVYTRLWYRFSRTGIGIPYPQRVVHTVPPSPQAPSHHDLLAGLDLLRPFSEQERAQLAQAAAPRRFGIGERLITEGAPGETFYVIASGEVMVMRGGAEVARLVRGAYLGEMSLLTGEPRAATVVAVTDVLALELGREAFAKHFAQHPERAQQLSTMLAARRAQLLAAGREAGANPTGDQGHDIFARLRHIFGL